LTVLDYIFYILTPGAGTKITVASTEKLRIALLTPSAVAILEDAVAGATLADIEIHAEDNTPEKITIRAIYDKNGTTITRTFPLPDLLAYAEILDVALRAGAIRIERIEGLHLRQPADNEEPVQVEKV